MAAAPVVAGARQHQLARERLEHEDRKKAGKARAGKVRRQRRSASVERSQGKEVVSVSGQLLRQPAAGRCTVIVRGVEEETGGPRK